MQKNRRFNFLINPKFQFGVIAWILFLFMLVLAAFFLSTHSFFESLLREAEVSGISPDHVLFTYIKDQRAQFYKTLLLTSLTALPVVLFGGILLSHRIAGPLYKLCQHLNRSSRSQFSEVRFRKGDYFQDVAKAFNDFIAR